MLYYTFAFIDVPCDVLTLNNVLGVKLKVQKVLIETVNSGLTASFKK